MSSSVRLGTEKGVHQKTSQVGLAHPKQSRSDSIFYYKVGLYVGFHFYHKDNVHLETGIDR